MKQKPMSIHEFEKGDLITRIAPSKPFPGLESEDLRDRAYIGIALKFLGVANGCVYVEKIPANPELDDMPDIGRFFKAMMGGESGPINLPLDMWDEGWSYYIDPYDIGRKLDNKFQDLIGKKSHTKVSKSELEEQLKKALDNEEYEKAEKLKKEIKNLK